VGSSRIEFQARKTLGDSDQATVMAVAQQARCGRTEPTKHLADVSFTANIRFALMSSHSMGNMIS
jgi:hypothetical protein